MTARSEETKRRLLEAACDEFASRGIAGARTGRIAQAAEANEALLFRYFGNKQQLFERAFSSLIGNTVEDVPINLDDLGAYAGALFDYYREHEQLLRLAVWAALEAPDAPAPAALNDATASKTVAIRQAQQAGRVTTQLEAGELLALVIHLSLSGASVFPSLGPSVDPTIRRRSVVEAVRVLTLP